MDATFVPPPVDEMNKALDSFEKFLYKPSKLPFLIKLAMIHYQFEAIHPFLDGNGRVGRLLIILLLCAEKMLPQPLLSLSAYFEEFRGEYYRRLLSVSQKGEWEEWIGFFLLAVAAQSRDAIRRSDRLLDLWKRYRAKMQKAHASALLLRMVDDLFGSPALTGQGTAKRLEITPRAAQLNIQKLVDAGIIEEATGQRRNRVYIASAIIRIIEGKEPDVS
jgi:Fic family protein